MVDDERICLYGTRFRQVSHTDRKHVCHPGMDMDSDVQQLLLRFKATTSPQDQQDLLSLVQEDKKNLLSGPLLLGKKQRDECEQRVVNTISTEDVFHPWSKFLIESSIANFPTSLKLKPHTQFVPSDADEDVDSILDPRFVLPQLWHLLSPRNLINCQSFVDRGGLSYALVALSSKQAGVRKIAYSVLQRFYRQLESMTFSTFKDRQLWLNFMDMLRICLTEENQQLRRLRTSFYTNCISVLRDPNHKLFGDVRQMILSHPNDDMEVAKELANMIRCSHPKSHREAFEWPLTVIVQGMDQFEDFDLLYKSLVFDLLLGPAVSPLFTTEERQMVLFVIEQASKMREAAERLCHKNALIQFLNAILFEPEVDEVSVVSMTRIACNISHHYCKRERDIPPDPLLFEVCDLLLTLSRHASKFSDRRKKLLSKFFDSFIHVATLVSVRRGSKDWLMLCDEDLTHIRTIESRLSDSIP
jgi:hypothetical protein